jgi:Flp pilus assembly protein TadG
MFRLRRLLTSVWRESEGSALVEAAILMPVLVTLMFGLFEFSWYFHKQQLVESGVRDAARYLTRVAPDGTNPCTLTNPVDFAARAKNIAVTGLATGGTARVPGWTVASVNLSCAQVDNSNQAYQGASTIYIVTASTSFADPTLGYFGLLGITSTPNLSASHTERSIGPG